MLRNPSVPTRYDHVKNSPIDILIAAGTDASQCTAHGPGLEPGGLDTHPAHFTIQARDKKGNPIKEGGDPFKVEVMGPSGPIPVDMKDNGDGTYAVAYNPDAAGLHDIAVTLNGTPIKGSTFKVQIKPGAFAGTTFVESFSFVIRALDKRGNPIPNGGEDVKVNIKGPAGAVQTKLEDRQNGQYVCFYKAVDSGEYHVEVLVNGQHLKGSPFTTRIV